MDFLILQKPFLMDKTITVCQKCLVDELVLSFWTPMKCAEAQSNLMSLSKVIALTYNNDDNRQTDNVVKTVFSHSGGLKTWSKNYYKMFCFSLYFIYIYSILNRTPCSMKKREKLSYAPNKQIFPNENKPD